MGRVQGKVAFITGAARGQGRSHAIRLAEEGADIIAVDICHSLGTVNYQLATSDDLKETVAAIEKLDRRIVAMEADVRDRSQLANALERGIAELGKVDVVVAQAGVAAMKGQPPPGPTWSTRPAKTPPRRSTSNRRCPSRGSSRPTSATWCCSWRPTSRGT